MTQPEPEKPFKFPKDYSEFKAMSDDDLEMLFKNRLETLSWGMNFILDEINRRENAKADAENRALTERSIILARFGLIFAFVNLVAAIAAVLVAGVALIPTNNLLGYIIVGISTITTVVAIVMIVIFLNGDKSK